MEVPLGEVAFLPSVLAGCASIGDQSHRRCELTSAFLVYFASDYMRARAKTTIAAFENQTKGAKR